MYQCEKGRVQSKNRKDMIRYTEIDVFRTGCTRDRCVQDGVYQE